MVWYAAIASELVIAALWFMESEALRYLDGLYVAVILIGGWSVLHSAIELSPVTLTAQGAKAVHTALLQFHEENGHYPGAVGELLPRYLVVLPQPLLLCGVSWCYEAQDQSHRFGYVYRTGFNAPASERIVGADGIAPDRAWTCTEAADRMNQMVQMQR